MRKLKMSADIQMVLLGPWAVAWLYCMVAAGAGLLPEKSAYRPFTGSMYALAWVGLSVLLIWAAVSLGHIGWEERPKPPVPPCPDAGGKGGYR